jgi:iron complex transport system substrate-binding protein
VPNVEELLKINPDVVIQWALKTDQYIEPMERVGLTVVGLSYGSYEIERDRVSIVGRIAQKEECASSFLAWHDRVRQGLDDAERHPPGQAGTMTPRSRRTIFTTIRSTTA